MPNLLDVFAIPRKERSRTRKLHDAFLRGWRQRYPDSPVQSVDLAQHHADLPVFDEWDVEAKFEMAYGEGKLDRELATRWNALTALTDQLHNADVVVVSTPMWNFTIPWLLKRWLDAVVQPRLTFEHVDGQYAGLLRGRQAVVLATRDGAYGPGTPFAQADFQVPYLKHVLGFMGLDPVHVVVAEPLAMSGPKIAAEALERAMIEASNLAQRL